MPRPPVIKDPVQFARDAAAVRSTKAARELLATLPITAETDYEFNDSNPARGWKDGNLHWFAVGGERGNGGRIKLAGNPENPIAERVVNAMEALIELERQREVRRAHGTPMPLNPREAILRYFSLPPLEELPAAQGLIRERKPRDYARDLARKIRVRLLREPRPVEYSIQIEDDGMGQSPERLHATVLSLGQSDKADKPYLIGVFGQGGSSAFAASSVSWIMSRRAPDLGDGAGGGMGWTMIRRVNTAGHRGGYWVYLAADPDGRVLTLPAAAADAIGLRHGTRIAHVNYDFGKSEPARTLYQSLNHLLFKPVLPYELYTGADPDPMWGNGYRLSRLAAKRKVALDKNFAPQSVVGKDND